MREAAEQIDPEQAVAEMHLPSVGTRSCEIAGGVGDEDVGLVSHADLSLKM